MTFATPADLASRYGDQELLLLADRDGDGVVDAGVVESHLADTDAEIVGLLAGSVRIDPTAVPLNLTRLACDICRYRLHGANPTDDVRARYKDAVDFLRRVAEGKASLDGGAAAPTQAQASPRPAASIVRPRLFSRDLL